MTVEPLKHLPVQRDLMVDQGEFFDRWRSVKPFLITDEPAPEAGSACSRRNERLAFDDPTKCILCAACYSACPILDEKNPRFIGPAAIVNAARFVFDSRDTGLERTPAGAGQPGRGLGLREPFRVHPGLPARDQGDQEHQPDQAEDGRMKLYEYQARELLAAAGIPVPPGKVAQSSEEAVAAARGAGPAGGDQGPGPGGRARQGRRGEAGPDPARRCAPAPGRSCR